jgi:hypothetical protein
MEIKSSLVSPVVWLNSTSNSPSSIPSFQVKNDAGNVFEFGFTSSTYTPSALLQPGMGFIYDAAGSILIATNATGKNIYLSKDGGATAGLMLTRATNNITINNATDNATAALQSTSTTQPIFAGHYDATHYFTMQTTPAGVLDIEKLTGLTMNAAALPNGASTDSAVVITTTANIATFKKYALSSLGGFTNPMTTIGDIIYGGASGVATRLAGNTTTARQFYTSTGTGSAAQAPTLGVLVTGDIPNNAANTSGTAANLSGTPTLPNGTTATTQAAGDNSTKLGTTGYTDAAVAAAKSKKFAMTSDGSVNNTSTPTSLIGTGVGSMTIPANTLIAGSAITFKGSGTIGTAATAPTMSFALSVGSSSSATAPTIGTSLNGAYEFQFDCIVRTTGAGGTCEFTGWVSIAGTKSYISPGSFALDTTTGALVDLVLTMGGTVGAGDVVTTKTSSLHVQ